MTKAVMTLHGFLTDVNDFGRLYDYLDGYDCVHKCKIPGHNDEVDFKKFTAQATIETILRDFDDLKERYDEVDVVGVSMGGALATYLCAVRDVHKAVLIAPANRHINFSLFKLLKLYNDTYSSVMENAGGTMQERVRLAREAVNAYRENTRTAVRIALQRILPNFNFHTYGTFRELMKICNDALEERGTVDTPSLIMWGELDELVPKQSVLYLKKIFTHCRVKIYHDVSHAMLYTNKDAMLISDITKFLKK